MQSLFAKVYVPLCTMSSPLSKPYGSSLESHAVVQWERVSQGAWPIWKPGNWRALLRFPWGTTGRNSLMSNWLETQHLGSVQENKTLWFSKSKINIDTSKPNYFARFHLKKMVIFQLFVPFLRKIILKYWFCLWDIFCSQRGKNSLYKTTK